MYEKIHLSDVLETFAFDSTKRFGGAPSAPGSIRSYEDATFGHRLYKLLLNESGGALALPDGGRGVQTNAGVLWAGPTISAVTAAVGTFPLTAYHRFGGVVLSPLGDDDWGWVMIRGEANCALGAGCLVNAAIECIAAGNFDDTAANVPVGFALATNGGGATAATRAFITAGQF